MNKYITILLLVCISILPSYAQSIVQPSEPNEACMEAWTNYQKADALWKTGWGLFGAGLSAECIGGILFWKGVVNSPKGGRNSLAMPITSVGLLGAGFGAVVASIPCLAIGQKRRKASLKTIEEWNCGPERRCEEIKKSYKKGNALWKAGWSLFGIGTATVLTGGALGYYYGVHRHKYGPYMDANRINAQIGYALIGLGSEIVVVSVPCLAIGQSYRKAAASPLDLTLQSSSNGLGLALHF